MDPKLKEGVDTPNAGVAEVPNAKVVEEPNKGIPDAPNPPPAPKRGELTLNALPVLSKVGLAVEPIPGVFMEPNVC